MPPPTTPYAAHTPRVSRLEVLFEEMAELTGQRNAIDGRVVEIVAQIDGRGTEDGNSLWGATGCRSIEAIDSRDGFPRPRQAIPRRVAPQQSSSPFRLTEQHTSQWELPLC